MSESYMGRKAMQLYFQNVRINRFCGLPNLIQRTLSPKLYLTDLLKNPYTLRGRSALHYTNIILLYCFAKFVFPVICTSSFAVICRTVTILRRKR